MEAVARTFYTVLGVEEDATGEAIKAAWRRTAKESHPDVCDDESAAARFKLASRAYEVLSDPERRARYDAWLGERRLPVCPVCRGRVKTGHGAHYLCALQLKSKEAEREREEPPPPPEKVEVDYRWEGDPATLDEMYRRRAEDYEAATGQVSGDELLQALMAEAALRSGRQRGRPGARISVTVAVSPELHVVLDEDGVRQLREAADNLKTAERFFGRLRRWLRP